MIYASLVMVGLLWACALGSCWSRTMATGRLWLSLLGMLTGIGIVMLSGRTVGLLWLMLGATALMGTLSDGKTLPLPTLGSWRPKPKVHMLWSAALAMLSMAILLWQPPADIPLAAQAVELATVAGIAFAHHTWAVVGIAVLGLLVLDMRATGKDR